jgi:Tol biopolymer transport system component
MAAALAWSAAALLAAAIAPTAARAQLPPNIEWRTIESANFRVTYSPGLEPLARHAAARGEIVYDVLRRELGRAPRGRIDMVLTGEADVSNGWATPFPSNRIVLFAHPPLNVFALEYQADWIELLVAHELTHIFHLDRAGSVGRALRTVLGRVPAPWPFFPVVGTPLWSIEGLAVQAESHLTGMGRLHGSFHEMVVRTAVLEGRFDPLDRVSNLSPLWPDGMRPYVYGSLFMDFLQRRHGDDAPRRLLDRTAGSILPPPLFFDMIGRGALGESFSAAYRQWRAQLETHYAALADSLTALGLTPSDRIVAHGRYALTPRVAPDGASIAYAAGDGRDAMMTRVIAADGRTLWQQRRTSLGVASWLPDGSGLVTSQLDLVGVHRMYEDLYLVSPRGERRLTRGARLQWPDVARDGRSIVAVQGRGDTNRLVIYDLESGVVTALTGFSSDVHWTYPRWSPDGTRIAASRWTRGGDYDLVILDARGGLLAELTDDRAIDGTPAWSPDGRYLVFSSDRTGIPNLYAAELLADGSSRLHRITNVLTGAVQPDVTPDGRSIVFVRYHADGFHIDRMPFDPATWRPAEPFALHHIAATRAPGLAPDTLRYAERAAAVDTAASPAARYRAWRHARPYFWLPTFVTDTVAGDFAGVWTAGRDLVGRHEYEIGASIQPASGRWQGDVSYAYGGLGNPMLDARLRREWEYAGNVRVQLQDTVVTRALLEREDVATLGVRLRRPRFRSSAVVRVAGEIVATRRELPGTPALQLADERDELFGVVVAAAFANQRTPAFAISPQDGVSLSASARRRWERAQTVGTVDGGYIEATAQGFAYRSYELAGFARHVFALRAAGLWRDGAGAPLTSVGGVTGERFLAVRGYAYPTRTGTTGWAASGEYRAPAALVGRGAGLLPIFLDRVALAAFVDAGDIRCNPDIELLRPALCARTAGTAPLVGAGGELILDTVLFFAAPVRVRIGYAAPLTGPARAARAYVAFVPSF